MHNTLKQYTMKLKNWKLKWAENIILKNEAAKLSREELRQKALQEEKEKRERDAQRLKDFANTLVKILEEDFVKRNQYKFEVGETVLLNWYAASDSWEGTPQSLLHYLDEPVGPVEMTVTSRWVSCEYFWEMFDRFNDLGRFDRINKDDDYVKFKNIFFDYMSEGILRPGGTYSCYSQTETPYPLISFKYKTFKKSDGSELFKYGLNENKFVKINTDKAKGTLKLWEIHSEQRKLGKKVQDLRLQVETLNGKANGVISAYELTQPIIKNT